MIAESSGIAHPAEPERWRVDIYLYEDRGCNIARTPSCTVMYLAPVDVRGEARRRPADPDLPTVGDEVAAARALRQLADRLLEMASQRPLGRRGPVRSR